MEDSKLTGAAINTAAGAVVANVGVGNKVNSSQASLNMRGSQLTGAAINTAAGAAVMNVGVGNRVNASQGSANMEDSSLIGATINTAGGRLPWMAGEKCRANSLPCGPWRKKGSGTIDQLAFIQFALHKAHQRTEGFEVVGRNLVVLDKKSEVLFQGRQEPDDGLGI